MHAARLDKSERLQRFVEALRNGPMTTRELIGATGLCAINSIAAECRANGIKVGCTYKGTSESGARIYEYELNK